MAERPIARIKAELQEKGVRIPAPLVEELEMRYNAPAVRTGRLVLYLESPRGNGELIPCFIVNGKRSLYSPFELTKNSEGQIEVRRNGAPYTSIAMAPRPRFYDIAICGKVAMHKVGVIVGPGHLRAVADQRCYYQQTGEACKFCAVQHWWNAAPVKRSEQIVATVEAAFREKLVQHVSLTTGTLNTPDRGLLNLIGIAQSIHLKQPLPVMLEIEPLRDHGLMASLLVEARDAGVTSISINVECFDERMRADIMPAKGQIPVREYTENWAICHHVFGQNEVSTVVIAGIGESDESILAGVAMAAARGVVTFLVPHSPAAGAIYEDMQPPPADRMLRLYERAVNIYAKNGLDLCRCTAGCVRGGGFSAIREVARFGV